MSRAETTAATRRAIVAAAREVLAEGEWRRFTLEAVAARAGVTRVTVYNQVRSKYGLLDAVLTELVARGGMDSLVTASRGLPAPDALRYAVQRTCAFWHAERPVLRPLFGLAAIDPRIAANLAQRERWRAGQLARLTGREPGDTALAAVIAVTSFPMFDGLGPVAGEPGTAAELMLRMARAVLD
jgi:AcrR family transcriptional regulator